MLGASNSKNPINKTLAFYAANQVKGAEAQVIDLNDFEQAIKNEKLNNDLNKKITLSQNALR